MSEPLIAVRFLKRHAVWNQGELASFPLAEARRLDALRIIQPLHVLVPATATQAAQEQAPSRAPAAVVRK